jgi:hypothetical protein
VVEGALNEGSDEVDFTGAVSVGLSNGLNGAGGEEEAVGVGGEGEEGEGAVGVGAGGDPAAKGLSSSSSPAKGLLIGTFSGVRSRSGGGNLGEGKEERREKGLEKEGGRSEMVLKGEPLG